MVYSLGSTIGWESEAVALASVLLGFCGHPLDWMLGSAAKAGIRNGAATTYMYAANGHIPGSAAQAKALPSSQSCIALSSILFGLAISWKRCAAAARREQFSFPSACGLLDWPSRVVAQPGAMKIVTTRHNLANNPPWESWDRLKLLFRKPIFAPLSEFSTFAAPIYHSRNLAPI